MESNPVSKEKDSNKKKELLSITEEGSTCLPNSTKQSSTDKSPDNLISTPSNFSELCEINSLTEKEDFVSPLSNPHLSNLDYIESEVPIHVNLYKLDLSKNYNLYEYSVDFIYGGDEKSKIPTALKKKILLKSGSQIKSKYGSFIPLGDAFYSFNQVNEINRITIDYHLIQYTLDIRPTKKFIEMKKDSEYMINQYNEGKHDIKSIFEIIVREILKHNPSLNYIMSLFGYKDEEKTLEAQNDYNNINIMPGFSTRVMMLESGIYLNVDIKTKITSEFNCLQLIETFPKDMKHPSIKEINQINQWFADKTIETTHTHQRYKVEEVNFDRTAENFSVKQDDKTISLVTFFNQYYGIKINPKSPLINAKKKKSSKNGVWLPPELCVIVGLDDEKSNDRSLTKEICKVTKRNPTDKVNLINDIVKLMNEKKPITKIKLTDGVKSEIKLKSSFEIKEEYGINILESNKTEKFIGKIMTMPSLIGKKGEIRNVNRTFKVYKTKSISSICLFHKKNESQARDFKDIMLSAVKEYGIVFDKCDFKHLNTDQLNEWETLIDKCIKVKRYNIILLLIDDQLDNKGFYDHLKAYLQEQKGVISQFIKTKSLRKNAMSITSNIAIQINSKLGGQSYIVDFDQEIKKKNLMIVGVDSSGYEINHQSFQSISFCATLDNDFGKYTNKKQTVHIENYDNTNYPIAQFMEMALSEYFILNGKLPGGVIIYRQGVSSGQKNYLSNEIEHLHKIFNGESNEKTYKGMKIPYYYIIVNKKTSLKFFEIDSYSTSNRNCDKGIYENPDSGLLVIDKVVSPNKFEFYIQPQKVNQGTATPTCYQVEYGTMDCPKIIPKLTFDLCFLYSNWRGPVRIPAPLKYAEKLAKSIAGVNDDIKNTLSYI